MRRVLSGEVTLAARALLAVPIGARQDRAAQFLRRAEIADAYRLVQGQAHPDWGNGTLSGVLGPSALPAERFMEDPAYLACHLALLQALQAHGRAR